MNEKAANSPDLFFFFFLDFYDEFEGFEEKRKEKKITRAISMRTPSISSFFFFFFLKGGREILSFRLI